MGINKQSIKEYHNLRREILSLPLHILKTAKAELRDGKFYVNGQEVKRSRRCRVSVFNVPIVSRKSANLVVKGIPCCRRFLRC